MEIFTSLNDIKINSKTAVALGTFDGIHLGHKVILEEALNAARGDNSKSLCFTFSNIPFNFIMDRDENDPHAIKYIASNEEKISIMKKMGFDYLANIPFDESMMKMRAKTFFHDILINTLNASFISVGFNYTYGARAEGRADDLIDEGKREGIKVMVHDAVCVDGDVVSSTLIREMILKGEVDRVSNYLGRTYGFKGRVEHGKKIGSRMGFPTVNIIAPWNKVLPPNGVYFSTMELDGSIYNSISNIGVKPTVGPADKTIETYIFDFNDETYGKEVIVKFEKFLREEIHFDSKLQLHKQIEKDCESAIKYHNKI